MSNRNATASWSGYSHQGQVGLLIALRKIQEPGIDLDTHFVQFETSEDVAIYNQVVGFDKTYLSVHQVKAYYSQDSNFKHKYRKVLNDDFHDGNEKFLHTAVEINDWDTSATTNNNNVNRYPYKNMQFHCDTTEIETFVKDEITVMLQASEPIINEAYCRLSFALDHQIRSEHKKANRELFDIKFSLREINDIVRSTETFDKKDLYDSRRLFYQAYIDYVKNKNTEEDRRNFLESTIIKLINGLDDTDFLLFLQRLNLNEKPENLNKPHCNYNPTGLKQVFFKLLINIIETEPNLIESSVKYRKMDDPNHFVLTSIIEEEEDKLEVVKKIIENMESQNLLWERHMIVNKEIEIEISKRAPIINGVATPDEYEDDKKKFMTFSDSKLVTRDYAKNMLNNEGDN